MYSDYQNSISLFADDEFVFIKKAKAKHDELLLDFVTLSDYLRPFERMDLLSMYRLPSTIPMGGFYLSFAILQAKIILCTAIIVAQLILEAIKSAHEPLQSSSQTAPRWFQEAKMVPRRF